MAFDGDADRIGAIDSQGRVILGDNSSHLAEPVLTQLPGATIIADVKASQTLFDRIAEIGGKPLMWNTGHSLIKSKMKETGAPLAGEMSGHIFFKHRWYGFDDALYAGVRLIRGVSRIGKSLPNSNRHARLGRHSRNAIPGRRKPQVRGRRRSRLAARRRCAGGQDRRRARQHPDGWWLLRASNTQDVSSPARGREQAGLDRLMATINAQLDASGIAAVRDRPLSWTTNSGGRHEVTVAGYWPRHRC